MNQDNIPADHVEANEWQAILRDCRTLLAWELVVTVLTMATVRQHLALAVAAAADVDALGLPLTAEVDGYLHK
jgi:hypothetical protein